MSDGFLVVDKAGGMTSHDVVAVGRKALGTRKVGHAGTLDPMATGILVLGFGNGTRLLQYITDGDKSYVATVVLGASTITDDKEGEVIASADASKVLDSDIEKILKAMIGTIAQRPSSVSAVKVGGERAYDRVRAGEKFSCSASVEPKPCHARTSTGSCRVACVNPATAAAPCPSRRANSAATNANSVDAGMRW